jgi:hypothetical protein
MGVGGCGAGKAAIQSSSDASASDASDADARDVADARAGADAEGVDVAAIDRVDAVEAVEDVEAGKDREDGAAADARPSDALDARASEAGGDVAVERPSATASWTLSPFPPCTATGAGCMDTGAVGGYQITASGACPTASDVQLWFPGGAAPVAAGTYAVKSAAGILDVIAMPAGMVGVLVERDDASMTQARFWGRSGSVTVTASGAARHVTFTGVSLKEETSGVAATLAADVTCP